MGQAAVKRAAKRAAKEAAPTPALAFVSPTAPRPTEVVWSVSDILAAFEDLTLLLRGNPDGAFGYKATIIRNMLEPIAVAASTSLSDLVKAYQKYLPKEGGGTAPVPPVANGRELPLDQWNKNPEEYQRKRAEINSTLHTLAFPVRFTFLEVSQYKEPVRDLSGVVANWQGIRGAFWRNLYQLIDPPADLANTELPKQGPTIDPLVAADAKTLQ